MATTSQPDATQAESDLTATLAAADTTTAARIQNLSMVHQARLAQLTRAAVNATAQYGAGSAQAAAAQADVTSAARSIGRIALVQQQVTTPVPQVAATGWALYGSLTTPPAQPLTGFAVFLVDANNAYQSTYGFTYTDSKGAFQLVYNGAAPSTSGAASSATKASATKASATAAPASPSPSASSQSELQLSNQSQEQPAQPQTQPAQTESLPVNLPTPTLYLEIANNQGEIVYRSSTAFTPTLGRATYQNIQLAAGAPAIGKPPEALRSIALPNLDKKS